MFRSADPTPQGGPKGIDISKDANELVATCESRALAFFDMNEVLRVGEPPANRLKRLLQWRLSNAMFNRLGHLPRMPALGRAP